MLTLKNIVLCRDFLPGSEGAVSFALDLAQRTGAKLHVVFADVLHADPHVPVLDPAPTLATLRERLKERFEATTFHYDPRTLWIEHAVVRGVAAAPAILAYAEAQDADLIVMGTHGRSGVRRFLLGSVAEEVVRLAHCPVVTVRTREDEDAARPVRSILVPVDFSRHARPAVAHARALAARFGARMDLLHVEDDHYYPIVYGPAARFHDAERLRHYEEALAELKALGEPAGEVPDTWPVETTYAVRYGSPVEEIVRYAEAEGSDLVVMSTHGRTGLEHLLIGSVAERVVRSATCPVLTLKSFGKTLVPTPAAPAPAEPAPAPAEPSVVPA